MSHHHHYQSLLQQFVSGLFESIGRTQPPHITHTYRSYVTDTPFAFFAYTAMAVYFAYRFKQSLRDKQDRAIVIATNERPGTQSGYSGSGDPSDSKAAQPTLTKEQAELRLQGSSRHIKDPAEFHKRQRQNDDSAIALCAIASLTALNWSVTPIIQVPQYIALGSCILAEFLFYRSGAFYGDRQKCNFKNKKEHGKDDNPLIKFAKCILATPFVYSIATTVGVDSYITK